MANTRPVLISSTTAAPESPRYPDARARLTAASSDFSTPAWSLASIFVIKLFPAMAEIFLFCLVTISFRLTKKVRTPGVPRKYWLYLVSSPVLPTTSLR